MLNSMLDRETYITRQKAAFHGIYACTRPAPGSTDIPRGSDAGTGGDSLS